MTSVKVLNGFGKDNGLTYPTVTKSGIKKLTPSQRSAMVGKDATDEKLRIDIDKFTKNLTERINYFDKKASETDVQVMRVCYIGVACSLEEILEAIKENTSE